jgi:hypothetical protein
VEFAPEAESESGPAVPRRRAFAVVDENHRVGLEEKASGTESAFSTVMIAPQSGFVLANGLCGRGPPRTQPDDVSKATIALGMMQNQQL